MKENVIFWLAFLVWFAPLGCGLFDLALWFLSIKGSLIDWNEHRIGFAFVWTFAGPLILLLAAAFSA